MYDYLSRLQKKNAFEFQEGFASLLGECGAKGCGSNSEFPFVVIKSFSA